ncbi:NHLP leader peptide family RiPP precursor [Actinomycetospora cinnamomea]|uniref:Putative ribosomally synthesized peptide n=1 Tax=Actinomycetospora cinnamomea TaxID=663609 RepID=A0A2U1FQZ4_9PSEU|nr:NHLP leader peptide family RiPP precursor [Actinomycetospora cinnamomea]PVZ14569.1 putative ribosomally synthesized peptide [Actinomycetospora cinnamomea]
MSETTYESKDQLQVALARRAQADPAFKEELLRDPRGAVAKEAGRELPADLEVHVLEDTASEVYLVLPALPAESGRLSDAELAGVAGGSGKSHHTDCASWVPTTCTAGSIVGDC